jgi:hypothetical protein
MSSDNGVRLSVARDFSDTPGPRYRKEGPHSGQEFYEEVLLPKFKEARQRGVKLLVDLDDTAGYATSFLEESFGNLAIEYGAKTVLANITVKSDDEAYLAEEIEKYVKEAKPRK